MFLLFFFSGAAALGYEITWARSLGLVFGASHLAVATVLAVYMGGQALGSALFGNRADKTNRPLRLYGILEVCIGISATAFLGLMRCYPAIYGPMARLAEGDAFFLTFLRTAFAVVAIIVPSTLMGGTLPVLTRFVVRRGEGVAQKISFLYAFNTFGAVAGALATGFVLLKGLGVTITLLVAATTSTVVGVAAILLERRTGVVDLFHSPTSAQATPAYEGVSVLARRITLLGIGFSGFCALGYEVLWTRMLTLVVGTSAYSFTIMLVAFLAGIGAGSQAFAIVRRSRWAQPGARGTVLFFGGTQLAIGVSALAVTILMRDLPGTANRLQVLLSGLGDTEFTGRLVASTGVAFVYMFVPAFFMGLAFPAAGAVYATGSNDAGGTVGRLLAANTVGAILGSVVSGFALIYLFGIERSLQMLVVVNIAMGLAVVSSLASSRWANPAVAGLAATLLIIRGAFPDWGRVWDQKYFATYTNNARSFETPDRIRQQLEDVDVLYYKEGVNETVSVIHPKGSVQTFIVNGRPEASTASMDVQLQRTLGHLPLLLHPNPRNVFVLGVGTGMTVGAASIHPEVERLVLAEIESAMLGVARTFDRWNSRVLDNPKLEIVYNDGRNFLATTRDKFDVISADPIHPWSGGAGYLYTREYFRSVADRLAPGGIACQWLPLYELTVRDVKTVVRTFADSFRHVMIWLTYYDAVLVGSEDPIRIDEAELARRLSVPAIREDLAPVQMGTSDDLLSFFLTGTSGARAFGREGDLNTDDNLTLEFSAPASQGAYGLDARNVLALAAVRENLLPYLAVKPQGGREGQQERWNRHMETSRLFDHAHAQFLLARSSLQTTRLLSALRARDPGYAPLRFLLGEETFWNRTEPALVEEMNFEVRTAKGGTGTLRISAVRQFLGRERVLVSFVDKARREIYGQKYIDGEYERLDGEVARYVAKTLASFRAAAGRVPPGLPEGVPAEADVAAALRLEAARLVGRLPDSGR